jgi:hypothetical protein
MPFITQSELPALLRPLINARLGGGSDSRGQRRYADVYAAWDAEDTVGCKQHPDCDIRGLTGAGIDRCWDGKGEVIRWDLVRRVTVGEYLRDAYGELRYFPHTTYHVVSAIASQVAA